MPEPAPGEPHLYATDLAPSERSAWSGEQVVFLHGLFGQGRNWTTIARALADTCRVLLLDLPDHGRSPWTRQVSYPRMAAAVAAELDLRGGRWTVVGHSMGGKVAMMVALTRPELVARLVVADMSPVSYARIGQESYVEAMRAVDLEALTGRGDAERQLARTVHDPTVVAFLLQNLRRTRDADQTTRWGWQFNLTVLGDGLRALADWPETADRTYAGPTLWIAGADSDYVTPAYAPAMRALFPRTRLVTIRGAGHWVHADRPETFTQTLRAFLVRTPPDAAATGSTPLRGAS